MKKTDIVTVVCYGKEEKAKTSNKVINVLMDELGVEVGEKFNILGSGCNPYYFNNNGILFDCNNQKRNELIYDLVYQVYEIEKLPKPKKMTLKEIEKELGYSIEIVEGEWR